MSFSADVLLEKWEMDLIFSCKNTIALLLDRREIYIDAVAARAVHA